MIKIENERNKQNMYPAWWCTENFCVFKKTLHIVEVSYIAGFFCKNDSLNPLREIMKDKDDKELKSGELSIY